MRALSGLADAAVARGVEVIKLNIGQPDFATPKAFWQRIDHDRPDVVSYESSAGMPQLREAVAADYSNYGGQDLSSADVLITVGASEAVSIALQIALDQGDELLVPEPFYANYKTIAQMFNINVKGIARDFASGFALPFAEVFAGHITSKTKAIMISNPDNPTGKVYSEEELFMLANLAEKHNLWLIVDEVYKDFVFNGTKFLSLLNLDKFAQFQSRVIVLDSISKKFSACGARIGAIITRNKEAIAAGNKYCQARLSAGVIDQLGALSLYEAGLNDFLKTTVNNMYLQRKRTLETGLRTIPGVEVPEVSGAFYLFVKLPVTDSWKFATWLLESFSFEGATVMLAPGSGFYENPSDGAQFVRLAYVIEEGKLEKAAKVLKAALSQYRES
jgi:aspartate aminotransferase